MESPKFGMTNFRSVCLNEQLSPGEDQMSRIFIESNMYNYRLSGNPVHWTALYLCTEVAMNRALTVLSGFGWKKSDVSYKI